MFPALLAAAAIGCLPADTPLTSEATCFFGSASAAVNALQTAAAVSGCQMVDGECTCPTTAAPPDVCTNWAVDLTRYFHHHVVAETDFVTTLTTRLDAACRTYGGQKLENEPPAEVPPDTFAAACDRLAPPPPATTAGISLALAVGTSLFAVIFFENAITEGAGRPAAGATVVVQDGTKSRIVY